MKALLIFAIGLAVSIQSIAQSNVQMSISKSYTMDSLGACQGVSNQNDTLYIYGDREVGMIRVYKPVKDSLVYLKKEIKLTINDSDVINHPTGIAKHEKLPVFIGNSIRLNKEGTLWKAVIYNVNWNGLLKSGKLDNNLINTIDDDTCIQGTRPEYVQLGKKWYVATADYGNKNNQVRLYDPNKLATCKKTSEAGVLYKSFTCSPWVQNLFWINESKILVLIQNQIEGRKWRFTFLDVEASVAAGVEKVIKQIDIERGDELEGFVCMKDRKEGFAVTSSRNNNVNAIKIAW
jgi:hypothetical protein